MSRSITIFYSWQSDLPLKQNKNFISTCLEKAVKEVSKKVKNNLNIEVNIDRDTKNKAGSPNISETIFDKIREAHIFICDVTIVNNSFWEKLLKKRLTPNPNVLIELGFSINLLGWERIICINNLHFGSVEDLPFDIRGHRISNYDDRSKNAQKDLINLLVNAILRIVSEYHEIERRHSINFNRQHDRDIYNKLNSIMSEQYMIESIETAVNSLFTTKLFYRRCREMSDFYQLSTNAFLDKEADFLFKEFLEALEEFRMLCATHFYSRTNNSLSIVDYEMSGTTITKELKDEVDQNRLFEAHKDPKLGETHPEADKRIYKLIDDLIVKQDKVKNKYREFAFCIKRKQLI
jgi:hypothetical protein